MERRRRRAGVLRLHKPVLKEVVLSHLALQSGHVVVDGTVGSGGHAEAILKAIGPHGLLIGLDQDEAALRRVQNRLQDFKGQLILKHLNFRHLDQALLSLNLSQVHAVLLDVGVSQEQLEDPKRGFSFRHDGPLDMRMDLSLKRTAADLIASSSEKDLADLFRGYGEERFAGRVARAIVDVRRNQPIRTTGALRELVEAAVPRRFHFGRIHPATRVFQALRIAVNDELGALEEVLPKAFEHLESGGRLAVISFHSLEDRMVKRFFLEQKKQGRGTIVTKKPVGPSAEELRDNPSARSAKLRVIEKG